MATALSLKSSNGNSAETSPFSSAPRAVLKPGSISSGASAPSSKSAARTVSRGLSTRCLSWPPRLDAALALVTAVFGLETGFRAMGATPSAGCSPGGIRASGATGVPSASPPDGPFSISLESPAAGRVAGGKPGGGGGGLTQADPSAAIKTAALSLARYGKMRECLCCIVL